MKIKTQTPVLSNSLNRFSDWRILFTVLLLVVTQPFVHAQRTLHTFVTETADLRDNGLVTDGTYLYGTHFDGHDKGNGSVFKIKPDGSDYGIIFEFENSENGTNPNGMLVIASGTLYGMTLYGGNENLGVIYKIKTDGTGFTKLLDFDGTNGALPYSSLTISGSVLFGTAQNNSGGGVLFKLNTDGSGHQTLLTFNGTNGYAPMGAVAVSGAMIYGSTYLGGTNNKGVIYKIGTDGSNYQKLFDFNGTNGEMCNGGITLTGTKLYGITSSGGLNAQGTVFSIDTDGTNFQTLHNFFSTEGFNPAGQLVSDGSSLYGVTVNGGNSYGVAYKINVNGSGFEVIHLFNQTDGHTPWGSLLSHNNKLFGHVQGGEFNYGVVFKLNPDGSEFDLLKTFEATNSGYLARSSVVLSPASAFATTEMGGKYNNGVVYKMSKNGEDYEVLHDFEGSLGKNPVYELTLAGDKLYGVTAMGGIQNQGVLFSLDTTGTNFSVRAEFQGENGAIPSGALIDGGSVFYGTTTNGGVSNAGLIYKLVKSSHELQTIFDFSATDVFLPKGTMVLSADTLYGMAYSAVANSNVLFSVKTDGTEFRKILNVVNTEAGRFGNSLTISGFTIYVSTTQGGTNDWGVLYKINKDGSGYQKLIDFDYVTNGAIPVGPIIESNGVIYGMAQLGPNDAGIYYSIKTDGTDFTILDDFSDNFSSARGRLKSTNPVVTTYGSIAFSDDAILGVISLESGGQKKGSIRRYLLNQVTDVEKSEPVRLEAYPNPAQTVLNIQTKRKSVAIRMIDMLGARVTVTMLDEDTIDVSHLLPGFYPVIVDSSYVKFLKQ